MQFLVHLIVILRIVPQFIQQKVTDLDQISTFSTIASTVDSLLLSHDFPYSSLQEAVKVICKDRLPHQAGGII